MANEPSALDEQNQPNADATEAPETDQPTDSQELSLDSFDPSDIPDDADREWFENRIKGFQRDYTKKTQTLAEERQEIEQSALQSWAEAVQQNPSLLKQLDLDERQLLETYGYAPGDDEEDDFLDPTERELQEIKEWKSHIEQQEHEAAQYEAAADFVEGELEKLEKQTGQSYDDEEAQWIFDFATARPTQRGVPDVKGAVQALEAVGNKRIERFKQAKSAPRNPAQGRSGSKAFDLSTEAGRLAKAQAAAEEAAASQS